MGSKETAKCEFCWTEQPVRLLKKCLGCGKQYCSICKSRTPWKSFVVKTSAGFFCQDCIREHKICMVCGASEASERCEACGCRACIGCMTSCSSCGKAVCKPCIVDGYSYCTQCHNKMMSYRAGAD